MTGFLSINYAAIAAENNGLLKINDYLHLTGELQASYENWDYFQPEENKDNNQYDLWEIRTRLGLMLKTPLVDGLVQGQYTGLYGLPNDAVLPPPIGPLGLGGAYYVTNNNSTSPDAVFLRQAYLNFKLKTLGLINTSLKIGRFEVADGFEYKSGDKKFDKLKETRISQRLVGSNAVYVQRTYDGFSAVYDNAEFNFTATGVRPTQGGFNVDGQDEISDIDVFYTALTSKKNSLLPGTEGRLFYAYYNDKRQTVSVDNRPPSKRVNLEEQGLEIHTLGAHILAVKNIGANSFDGLLWGAYQTGNWTNQTQDAYAFDMELGYQRTDLPLKPWLRGVYYLSSGDNDANDNQHNTFFSILPSGRRYAKFPFYNLMNIQDTFAELILSPTEKAKVIVDFHHLQVAETNDLFYSGLGAVSRSGAFGYGGRIVGKSNQIGQMLDLTLSYNFSQNVAGRFYYAHAFGGPVIENTYPAQNHADMAWIELNAVF